MKAYGLIGFPLSHSFSKKYFTEKFQKEEIADSVYELFPIKDIAQFPEFLKQNPSLCGLNVTIPHKVSILPFLQEIDAAAQEIGAVNCIDIKKVDGNFILKGFNTDAFGFEESLKPLLKSSHKKALVFGNGGAAKAVRYVLKKLNIAYTVVVRNKQDHSVLYPDLTSEMIASHTLLINTTPLGMSPNVETAPDIDYTQIGSQHLAYDLVYNPLETNFLKRAASQGAMVKNGLEMLHKQAEQAWVIWNK